MYSGGASQFDVSVTGTLVYATDRDAAALVWVDMESSMRRALEERMKDQRSSLAQTRDAIFGK